MVYAAEDTRLVMKNSVRWLSLAAHRKIGITITPFCYRRKDNIRIYNFNSVSIS